MNTYMTEMEEYLSVLRSARLAPPPRETLAWAAGGEMFCPEVHLACNAAPYILIGEYIRQMSTPPRRILDLGFGTGYDTAYLKHSAAPNSVVTGIDHIPELTAYATANYATQGLTYMTADSCALSFEDDSFDMITAVFSILHNMTKPQARACLLEIGRVLKPGGVLIATTPNRKRSQDLYHVNPTDNPKLMFNSLLCHEYDRDELVLLLSSLTDSKGRLFKMVAIENLTNTAFGPIWEEAILTIRQRRFSGLSNALGLSGLLRRVLPTGFRAMHFFKLIQKLCCQKGVSLGGIAQGVVHYPEGEGPEADHFVILATKRML